MVTGNWGKVSGVSLNPDMSACRVIYQNVQRKSLAGLFFFFFFHLLCCCFFAKRVLKAREREAGPPTEC